MYIHEFQLHNLPLDKLKAYILPAGETYAILLHGGTESHHYYDLAVQGYPDNAYSMAQFLAERGISIIWFDSLGAGENACPVHGAEITPEVQAAAYNQVVTQIREQMAPRAVFGVGHSMGAMPVLAGQALHRTYDGIAVLGLALAVEYPPTFGQVLAQEIPLPIETGEAYDHYLVRAFQAVTDERGYLHFPRKALYTFFHADNVPREVIEADDSHATTIPIGVAAYAVGPGLTKLQQFVKQIDVPFFQVLGEWDPAPHFREEVAQYCRVTNYRFLVLPEASHCHNFAPTRKLLWAALSTWMDDIVHLHLAKDWEQI